MATVGMSANAMLEDLVRSGFRVVIKVSMKPWDGRSGLQNGSVITSLDPPWFRVDATMFSRASAFQTDQTDDDTQKLWGAATSLDLAVGKVWRMAQAGELLLNVPNPEALDLSKVYPNLNKSTPPQPGKRTVEFTVVDDVKF